MYNGKLKVGDVIWSDYFNRYLRIVRINSDTDWAFSIVDDKILTAQTPLSAFEQVS